MRGDFYKKDLKRLSTGDLVKLQAEQATFKAQMLKVSTLQADYASMFTFIQKGDKASALARIDLVMKELSALKTDLPTVPTLPKK